MVFRLIRPWRVSLTLQGQLWVQLILREMMDSVELWLTMIHELVLLHWMPQLYGRAFTRSYLRTRHLGTFRFVSTGTATLRGMSPSTDLSTRGFLPRPPPRVLLHRQHHHLSHTPC